jgi:transcriptional regulator with XRE-family HTH domain
VACRPHAINSEDCLGEGEAMTDIGYRIGQKIRELREQLRLSQGDLAGEMQTTANTISRWETGTYKLTVSDLERLAMIFHVPLAAFFPPIEAESHASALLHATGDLQKEDLAEVIQYAEFRRARAVLKERKSKRTQHRSDVKPGSGE